MLNRRAFFLGLPLLAACRDHGKPARGQPLDVGLPYPAGARARCIQGPQGFLSHKGTYAWDFDAPWDSPVVAAAAGRVIWVMDDSARRGSQEPRAANRVFLDHGDGLFSTYLHHRRGSATVRVGDLVSAGTALARVGNSGTIDPHIHFDLRGPTWERTHDLRFHTAEGAYREVNSVYGYTSSTKASAAASPPVESRLRGDEFRDNGVTFAGGGPAFVWEAGEAYRFVGRAENAQRVGFYLWPPGEASVFRAKADVDGAGAYELTVRVPERFRGSWWWRIVGLRGDELLGEAATLPLSVL